MTAHAAQSKHAVCPRTLAVQWHKQQSAGAACELNQAELFGRACRAPPKALYKKR